MSTTTDQERVADAMMRKWDRAAVEPPDADGFVKIVGLLNGDRAMEEMEVDADGLLRDGGDALAILEASIANLDAAGAETRAAAAGVEQHDDARTFRVQTQDTTDPDLDSIGRGVTLESAARIIAAHTGREEASVARHLASMADRTRTIFDGHSGSGRVAHATFEAKP